jgi:hypothetical protein
MRHSRRSPRTVPAALLRVDRRPHTEAFFTFVLRRVNVRLPQARGETIPSARTAWQASGASSGRPDQDGFAITCRAAGRVAARPGGSPDRSAGEGMSLTSRQCNRPGSPVYCSAQTRRKDTTAGTSTNPGHEWH